jgi:hypothetical protein
MHGIDHAQISKASVGYFFLNQRSWNDANDFSALRERGIREHSHQSYVPAAIDNRNSVGHEVFRKHRRSQSIARPRSGTGAAKNTETVCHSLFKNIEWLPVWCRKLAWCDRQPECGDNAPWTPLTSASAPLSTL